MGKGYGLTYREKMGIGGEGRRISGKEHLFKKKKRSNTSSVYIIVYIKLSRLCKLEIQFT